jgi:hypothetical protein
MILSMASRWLALGMRVVMMAIAQTLFCASLRLLPEPLLSTTFASIRISPCPRRILQLWRIRVDGRGITRRIMGLHVAIRIHSRRGDPDLCES